MREIKFKVYKKQDNQYIGIFNLKELSVNKDKSSLLFDTFKLSIDDVVLKEFTGYQDVNGKDIYDGDSLGCKANKVEFSFGCWNTNGDRPLEYQKKLELFKEY